MDSFRFGLKAIALMKKRTEELSAEHGVQYVLEQTPAESTGYRLAKLDLGHYKEEVLKVVKGNEEGGMYYTNSTYLNVGADISPIERVKKEGMFHPMIEAGSLTHVWLGEARPDPSSLSSFVLKTFKNTTNDQIAFSPEFTSCLDCGKTTRGLH